MYFIEKESVSDFNSKFVLLLNEYGTKNISIYFVIDCAYKFAIRSQTLPWKPFLRKVSIAIL